LRHGNAGNDPATGDHALSKQHTKQISSAGGKKDVDLPPSSPDKTEGRRADVGSAP
jgi:hypothetical protein